MQQPFSDWRRTALTVALFVPLLAACFGLVRSSAGQEFWPTWLLAGLGGAVAASLYWHRYRGLGFVPLFTALAALSGIWVMFWGWCPVTVALSSFALGFALVQAMLYLRRFERVWGLMLLSLILALIGLIAIADINTVRNVPGPPIPTEWFLIVTGLTAIFASVFLLRPAIELCSEPILWIMYRVQSSGPGITEMPVRGPCLVVANHACWFDPFFLAKVLPRPITPMMTSRFYDLPVARWLLRNVFPTIRVPERALKQDIPDEIHEAIAVLDRGQCVVIFPEGFLRRSDDKPLKRFGRGAWQILSARPETPVVVCWIEGNWGSYASYCNGPPTKNKRMDFRRPIGVAVEASFLIEPELLKSHLATRVELMNRVAAARRYLGLEELPRFELPEHDAV